MKNKRAYCVLAAVAVVAVSFGVRQRTLSELRASTRSLRRELDARVAPAASASDSQSTNAFAALTPDERSELNKLRGQILPLRRELEDLSNRVATVTQPKSQRSPARASESSPEMPAKVQERIAYRRSEEVVTAQRLGDALREYMQQHAGELPRDLAETEAYARTKLPEGLIGRFELMRSGTVPEEERNYLFAARERQPRQLPDGRWVRIYIHANGFASPSGPSEEQPDWSEMERIAEALGKQAVRKEQREAKRKSVTTN